MKKKNRLFHKLFADYFLLNLVLIVNLIHLVIMVIYTVWNRMDYKYFALHINREGGLWELLVFLFKFLLPSVLAYASAIAYRLIDKKPKLWRNLVRAVSVVLIVLAGCQTFILTLIFEPSMPVASFTRNEENIFRYDTMVHQSLPSTNCPDLTREIPEHAEDVDFSYWYIDIMDYEWKIHVAYTLPEEEYTEMRDAALLQLEAMEDMQVTEEDGFVVWDTVDYRQNLGRAYTHLIYAYDDDACRISYDLSCFRYEGYR